MTRSRCTNRAAEQLGINRQIAGFLWQFGIVKSVQMAGATVVWTDEAMEEARQALANRVGREQAQVA